MSRSRSRGRRTRAARYPFTIDKLGDRGLWIQQAGRTALSDAKAYVDEMADHVLGGMWRVRHGNHVVYTRDA